MNTFLRFFYLVIFSFILSSEVQVYSAARSVPVVSSAVVSPRENIQRLIYLFGEPISCDDSNFLELSCPQVIEGFSKMNSTIEVLEKKIMDFLGQDSLIMASDMFYVKKGFQAQQPLLYIIAKIGCSNIALFLINNRGGGASEIDLNDFCLSGFFQNLKILAILSPKVLATKVKSQNYVSLCLEIIKRQKTEFATYLKLFNSETINFNWFILREAFYLRLKYEFNDEIDKELSFFYQVLLPYYPLDKEKNFLDLFFKTYDDPCQEYIKVKDKGLYFYETVQKIGKELVLKELELFKEDKKPVIHKGLLFKCVKFGCSDQLDGLVKLQDDWKSLVNPNYFQSVLFLLKELEDLKDKNLFSDKDFLAVHKAAFRFFSYIFDAGFYTPCLFRDQETVMFHKLMKNATLQGLNLIHRAVRGGNAEAVKFLLDLDFQQINLETDEKHAIQGLTPICLISLIQDPVKKAAVIAVFKEYCEKNNRILTVLEKSSLGSDNFQKKSSEELRLAWRQMLEVQKQKDIQKKLSDLKEVANAHQKTKKEKQALRQKGRDDLSENESNARNTLQHDFVTDLLLPVYTAAVIGQESIQRNALGRELLPGHADVLQHHNRLRLMQGEYVNRTKIEDDGLSLLAVPFYVGQTSALEQVRAVTERFISFQAASPSKGKRSPAPQTSASSSSSSLKSLPGDLESTVSLALTPRGKSKVTYVLRPEQMAKSQTKHVALNSEMLTSLDELGQAEQNPFCSAALIAQAIPCDKRVEDMRATTISLKSGTLEQLSAGNYELFDHAMSTDFIRKLIQCGSVYGQLRQNKQGAWVFNVLLVAAIQEMNYSGQLESLSTRTAKQWVTLGFEVPVTTGDLIVLGNVYHFCVQEKHPRFVKEIDMSYRYYLAPLDGVSGFFEKNVLKLRCNGGALRGVNGLLERLSQDGQKAYEEYWDSLK